MVATHLTAAPAAVANRFVVSVNMKVGTYTLANAGAMPTAGGRHVTLCRTVAGDADTPGTVVVVGRDLAGQVITETLTPGAHGVTVAGTKWFASVTSVTGAGWVIDVGTSTNDTIVVGCGAEVIVAEAGAGKLDRVIVNATAAGVITISDSTGTLATIQASVEPGPIEYDLPFAGYLSVILAASSDVTVIHSGSMPSTYAM